MVSTLIGELTPIEQAKRKAAYTCAEKHVHSGAKIGVGSGSTVKYLVEFLAHNYATGVLRDIICVPTSYMTKRWLLESGLPVSDLDSTPELDVCIDGADEIDCNFVCIKGGGGCLAQEKIVQHASKRFHVIADYTKDSIRLGDRFHFIPIEVLPFAAQPLLRSLARTHGGTASLRMATKKCGPVITDNNNYIIDWVFDKTKTYEWTQIQSELANTPGVVETGLFINVVDSTFLAFPDGSVKESQNTKKMT